MSDDQHPDDQQAAKPTGPVPISPAPISLQPQQPNAASESQTEPSKAPISLGGSPAPLSPTPPVQPGSYYPPQPVAPVNYPYQQPPQQTPAQPYQPPQMPTVPVPGQPGQYPPAQMPAAVPIASPGYPAQPPASPVPYPPVATPVTPSTAVPTAPTAVPVHPPTTPAKKVTPPVAKKDPKPAKKSEPKQPKPKQPPASKKKTAAAKEPSTPQKKQPAKQAQSKTQSKPDSSTAKPKQKDPTQRKPEEKSNPARKKKYRVIVGSKEPVIVDPSLAIDAVPISESIDVQAVTVQTAPPWLVSMLIHMVIVIALALFTVREEIKEVFTIQATYAEKLGEQLDKNVLTISEQEFLSESLEGSLTELPNISDPAAPKSLTNVDQFSPNATTQASIEAPGVEFDARGQGSQKRALLKAYGGNSTTEESVRQALEWLKRQQTRDGSWSLKGPYRDGSGLENKVAATAMALLAFQGAGHTDEVGDYQSNVIKGWDFLFKEMDRDSNFIQGGIPNQHVLYSQAQATIALCELYGMTQREDLREPAQRAIDYAVRIQSPEGGWKYTPGQGSDTSVTGWFVMALQSAKMSGLEVPDKTFQGITKFLDSVQKEDGSKYTYHSRSVALSTILRVGSK